MIHMLRLLLGLLGIAGLIVATPLLIGGGTVLMVETTLTDAEGFITSTPIEVDVDGYALVAGPAEIDISPEIPLELGQMASIRLQIVGEGERSSQGVFVGIADSGVVDDYLGGVPYAVPETVDEESMTLSYRVAEESGALPGRPADQPFWIASTSGTGPQELVWEIEDGTYSIVVMNDDASDGLSFETRIGAHIPLLKPIGTGLLVGGSVVMALGALLVALAVF